MQKVSYNTDSDTAQGISIFEIFSIYILKIEEIFLFSELV
jgi:hypothetical protein